MKETEIVELFALIRLDFPYFEHSDERVQHWYRLMVDLPFEEACRNFVEHVRTSDREPKPANIIRADRLLAQNQDMLRLEAADHISNIDRWASSDASPPDGFWESTRKRIRGEQT
ncbi:hypothetical protein [Paenibacillus sp. NRS-1760]|uniref:hypothetical protein n=1 Tax=Paenibacillus sp. NRS-1760 TaxID=3233902 RepID=UPI003D28E3F4